MTGGNDIPIDPAAVQARIDSLGAFGANPATGGVTRFVYDESWRAAKAHVKGWLEGLGLAVHEDAVGNVIGTLSGTTEHRAVVTGSHVDTVIEGGRYDGALGVIASITALEALMARFGIPRRTVRILVTCDEEGGRFRTNFWGAHGFTGEATRADAERIVDDGGTSIATAMRSAGYDPAAIDKVQRPDVAAWLELHIEQGRVLEESGQDVGIVTTIAGHVLWDVRVTGREDHAGTAPMDVRHDALAGAAEMVEAAIAEAISLGRPAVTTCGRMKAQPGIANVVPESVTFSLDIRDESPARFHGLLAAVRGRLDAIAERRGLQLELREAVRREPTPMSEELVALLRGAAARLGMGASDIPSMAGHDSEVMAHLWPSAMIFVPSRDGRSHSPDEFTAIPQIMPGIRLLAEALYELAYRAPG